MTKLSLKAYPDQPRQNRRVLRASLSGLIAGLGTAYTALADNGITAQEGVGIALTVAIAVAGVYGVKADN